MGNYREGGIRPESLEYSLSRAANAVPGSGSEYIGSVDFSYSDDLDASMESMEISSPAAQAQKVFENALAASRFYKSPVKVKRDGRVTSYLPIKGEKASRLRNGRNEKELQGVGVVAKQGVEYRAVIERPGLVNLVPLNPVKRF